jgi:hypothetical protein
MIESAGVTNIKKCPVFDSFSVLGMSWNLKSRTTDAPIARVRRTMSGPAAEKSSLPILQAPTVGATCAASSSARPAVGKSSATMMGSAWREHGEDRAA